MNGLGKREGGREGRGKGGVTVGKQLSVKLGRGTGLGLVSSCVVAEVVAHLLGFFPV